MSRISSRQELGQAIADLCAGCRSDDVLAALMDNLGIAVISTHGSPEAADAFLADAPDDLRRFVRQHWHDIKRESSEQQQGRVLQ